MRLCEKTINAYELQIKAKDVKGFILNTPRINLKDLNIELHPFDDYKLKVFPNTSASEKVYFSLQMIKRKLGHIIVKGIPTISRAVINKEKDQKSDKFRFFGYFI